MKKILILGDGVAARACYHYCKKFNLDVEVLSLPNKAQVNVTGGVRYLHPPASDQWSYRDFLEETLGNYELTPIKGGVVWYSYDPNEGEMSLREYFWETLLEDEALKRALTGMYALQQQRTFSSGIMNRLSIMDGPPQSLKASYSDVVGGLAIPEVTRVNTFDMISLKGKEVLGKDVDDGIYRKKYDYLINTIPLNVLTELLGDPYTVKVTPPRRELGMETNVLPDSRIMWYVVGIKGLKRISLINGHLKIETTGSFDLASLKSFNSSLNWLSTLDLDKLEFQKLPPNLPPQSRETENKLQQLAMMNIHNVGRFAELDPTMLFGDIIESAATTMTYISQEG